MPSQTTEIRKNIQKSAKNGDIESLRIFIHELYGNDSPFKNTEHFMSAPTMLPLIEAAVLSKASTQNEIHKEILLDIKHFHRAFGMDEEEYEEINNFLTNLDGDHDEMLNNSNEFFKNTYFSKIKFIK